MRKSFLAVLPLTLLAATLSGGESAQAAAVAQIAWNTTAHTGVRVNWPAHDGAVKVIFKSPLLEPRTLADQVTGTETVVSRELFPRPLAEAVIEVQDAKTNGLVAQSAKFDTSGSYPAIDWPGKVSANGTVTVSWTMTPNGEDSNPNDPLDVKVDAAQVRMTGTNGCTWTTFPAVSGQKASAVLPHQTPPFRVSTVADGEWGQVHDEGLAVVNFAVSQKVPASTPYGDDIRIPFTSDAIRPGKCVNGVAGAPYKVPVQNTVDLQTKNSPTAGWASTGSILWPGAHPKVFLETSIGARQYRTVAYNDAQAVVLGMDNDHEVNFVVGYGAVSPAASMITPYKLVRAKFNQSTVTLGQKATAVIGVKPYNNVTATIQRWNGKAWVTHSSVPVRSGDGTYSYTPTARGTQTFRFLVPSSTYGGLKIDWIATAGFNLTVR